MVDEKNRQSKSRQEHDRVSGPDIHDREKAIHELVSYLSSSDTDVENAEGQSSNGQPILGHHLTRNREEVVRENNILHKSGGMAASTRRQYLTALEAFKVGLSYCTVSNQKTNTMLCPSTFIYSSLIYNQFFPHKTFCDAVYEQDGHDRYEVYEDKVLVYFEDILFKRTTLKTFTGLKDLARVNFAVCFKDNKTVPVDADDDAGTL